MKGRCGKLLDIDLTSGKTKELIISEEIARKYVGGRGLGARLLYDLLPPKTDPLSPENILIFLTGPFTGSMAPGSSKFVVVTKSPLTGGWCDSYSSGRVSLELKKAGYDGLVIRGRANSPCYLQIGDGGVEIRDAGRLWGMDSFAAEKALKELPGNAAAAVSSIGTAGEKLCSYACINSEFYRQAARGGVGTVMGSKRLKAIVVKGSGNVEYHDHQTGRRAQPRELRARQGKPGLPGQVEIRDAADAQFHPYGRDPAHEEFPVRHLGQGPGEDRFGRRLQERQSTQVLPVLFRPLQPDHRGRRGQVQGDDARRSGIRDPRHVRVQSPDRLAPHRHPGQRPLRQTGAGHHLGGKRHRLRDGVFRKGASHRR